MKKLWLALALVLLLCFGLIYMGVLPDSFYRALDEVAPPKVAQALYTMGGIQRVELILPPEEPLSFVGFEVQPGAWDPVTQALMDGIRAQKDGITIPIALPADATEEEITAILLRQVEQGIDLLRREVPEIFWISLGSYVIEWSGQREAGTLTVYIGYCYSREEIEEKTKAMAEILDEVLEAAPEDAGAAVIYFHDWLVNHTSYASDLAETGISMHGYEYGFNIDGVFLQGRAVCEGYSKAFKLLCDRAGIPNQIVFGMADEENHSWNYVQLEGSWYLVDATWDDPVGSEDMLLHNYLLRGKRSDVNGRSIEAIYHPDGAGYPELSDWGYFEDGE